MHREIEDFDWVFADFRTFRDKVAQQRITRASRQVWDCGHQTACSCCGTTACLPWSPSQSTSQWTSPWTERASTGTSDQRSSASWRLKQRGMKRYSAVAIMAGWRCFYIRCCIFGTQFENFTKHHVEKVLYASMHLLGIDPRDVQICIRLKAMGRLKVKKAMVSETPH